jgi:hypothetical protein
MVDFFVARDRGTLPICRIAEPRVPRSFSYKMTSVFVQVPKQIEALHTAMVSSV